MSARVTQSALDPAVAARLKRDSEGLVCAVVQSRASEVLMVGWMDDEALHRTLTTRRGTYWSRSREEYWVKGDTSGHVQQVHEVRLDCDGDAVIVVVSAVDGVEVQTEFAWELAVQEDLPRAIFVNKLDRERADFQATLDVVAASRFSSAYTFQYSVRPGTPAGEMADQVPKAVVQERFERLVALQDRIAAEENRAVVGRQVELLVTAEAGKKSEQTHRLSGRARDQRLVHFSVPEGAEVPRPGDFVSVVITGAAAYHLVADPRSPQDYALRRSRAGDAWDRRQAESCGVPAAPGAAGPGPVSLGMPGLPVR